MPAVNFKVRWPNGQESTGYSPSTIILNHLREGGSYPLDEFLGRLECGLNAASERVREVKGFYCSSAMDSLSYLKAQGGKFTAGEVTVVSLQEAGAGHVISSGWGSF